MFFCFKYVCLCFFGREKCFLMFFCLPFSGAFLVFFLLWGGLFRCVCFCWGAYSSVLIWGWPIRGQCFFWHKKPGT